MSEERMVATVSAALQRDGIADEILVAGQFQPRGSSGGMFAGGTVGDVAGSVFGTAGDAVGVLAGVEAGRGAAASSAGLPREIVVGVSAEWVYGVEGRSSRPEPGRLVFRVPRAGLEVRVHQRVNVRVVELVHPASGDTLELEGNRLPVTHTKDVVDVLRAGT